MENLVNFNDIIFQNRNKNFGAYLHRKLYNQNILFASLISTTFLTIALISPIIYKYLIEQKENLNLIENKIEVEIMKLKVEDIIPIPPSSKISIPNVSTVKFLPPEITSNEKLKEDELPTEDELKQSVASDVTFKADSTSGSSYVTPVATTAPTHKEEIVSITRSASFLHGDLKEYLQTHLKYPARAKKNEIEGTVTVGFFVSPEGNVVESKIISGIDSECDAEALRVVNSMPKWEPGIQNGFKIKQPIKVRIDFTLDDEE